METEALTACLSAHLKLPISNSSLLQPATARTTLVINAGQINAENRVLVREQAGHALFLLLQDDTSVEVDTIPKSEETDVMPLDTAVGYSDFLEDARGFTEEFMS